MRPGRPTGRERHGRAGPGDRPDLGDELRRIADIEPEPRVAGILFKVLLAAAVVGVAAGIGVVAIYGPSLHTSTSDQPVAQISVEPGSLAVFDGDPESLTAADGNLVEPGAGGSSGPAAVARSRLVQAQSSGKTDGVFLTIPADVVRTIAGKTTRITAWVRQAMPKPARRFAMAYSTSGSGNSGWIVFTADTAYSDYSFDFRIPASRGNSAHHIGFWADLDGDNGGIELRLVTVRPLM